MFLTSLSYQHFPGIFRDKPMADKLMYITNEITSYVDYNYGLKRLDIDLMNQPIFHYLLVPKVV